MASVQILYMHDTLVLRQKHSELVIVPQHVENLKKLKDPKAFSQYFLEHALVNRSARKLFIAWVRKDSSLWKKIYETINAKGETKESDNSDESNLKKVQS